MVDCGGRRESSLETRDEEGVYWEDESTSTDQCSGACQVMKVKPLEGYSK